MLGEHGKEALEVHIWFEPVQLRALSYDVGYGARLRVFYGVDQDPVLPAQAERPYRSLRGGMYAAAESSV